MSLKKTCSQIFSTVNWSNSFKSQLWHLHREWQKINYKSYPGLYDRNRLQQWTGGGKLQSVLIYCPTARYYSTGVNISLIDLIRSLKLAPNKLPKAKKKLRKTQPSLIAKPRGVKDLSNFGGPLSMDSYLTRSGNLNVATQTKKFGINYKLPTREKLKVTGASESRHHSKIKVSSPKSKINPNALVKMPPRKEGLSVVIARLKRFLNNNLIPSPTIFEEGNKKTLKNVQKYHKRKALKLLPATENPDMPPKPLLPKPLYRSGHPKLKNNPPMKMMSAQDVKNTIEIRKKLQVKASHRKKQYDHSKALLDFLLKTKKNANQVVAYVERNSFTQPMNLGKAIFTVPKQKREVLSVAWSSNTAKDKRLDSSSEPTQSKTDQTPLTRSTQGANSNKDEKNDNTKALLIPQTNRSNLPMKLQEMYTESKLKTNENKLNTVSDQSNVNGLNTISKVAKENEHFVGNKRLARASTSTNTAEVSLIEHDKSKERSDAYLKPRVLLPPPLRPDMPVATSEHQRILLRPPPNRPDEIEKYASTTGNSKTMEPNQLFNKPSSVETKKQTALAPSIIRTQQERVYGNHNEAMTASVSKYENKIADKFIGEPKMKPNNFKHTWNSINDNSLFEGNPIRQENSTSQKNPQSDRLKNHIAENKIERNFTKRIGEPSDQTPSSKREKNDQLKKNILPIGPLIVDTTKRVRYELVETADINDTTNRGKEKTNKNVFAHKNEEIKPTIQLIEERPLKRNSKSEENVSVNRPFDTNEVMLKVAISLSQIPNKINESQQLENNDKIRSPLVHSQPMRGIVVSEKSDLKPHPNRPDMTIDPSKILKPPPDRPSIPGDVKPKKLLPYPLRPMLPPKPKRVNLRQPPSRPDIVTSKVSKLTPPPDRPDDHLDTTSYPLSLIKLNSTAKIHKHSFEEPDLQKSTHITKQGEMLPDNVERSKLVQPLSGLVANSSYYNGHLDLKNESLAKSNDRGMNSTLQTLHKHVKQGENRENELNFLKKSLAPTMNIRPDKNNYKFGSFSSVPDVCGSKNNSPRSHNVEYDISGAVRPNDVESQSSSKDERSYPSHLYKFNATSNKNEVTVNTLKRHPSPYLKQEEFIRNGVKSQPFMNETSTKFNHHILSNKLKEENALPEPNIYSRGTVHLKSTNPVVVHKNKLIGHKLAKKNIDQSPILMALEPKPLRGIPQIKRPTSKSSTNTKKSSKPTFEALQLNVSNSKKNSDSKHKGSKGLTNSLYSMLLTVPRSPETKKVKVQKKINLNSEHKHSERDEHLNSKDIKTTANQNQPELKAKCLQLLGLSTMKPSDNVTSKRPSIIPSVSIAASHLPSPQITPHKKEIESLSAVLPLNEDTSEAFRELNGMKSAIQPSQTILPREKNEQTNKDSEQLLSNSTRVEQAKSTGISQDVKNNRNATDFENQRNVHSFDFTSSRKQVETVLTAPAIVNVEPPFFVYPSSDPIIIRNVVDTKANIDKIVNKQIEATQENAGPLISPPHSSPLSSPPQPSPLPLPPQSSPLSNPPHSSPLSSPPHSSPLSSPPQPSPLSSPQQLSPKLSQPLISPCPPKQQPNPIPTILSSPPRQPPPYKPPEPSMFSHLRQNNSPSSASKHPVLHNKPSRLETRPQSAPPTEYTPRRCVKSSNSSISLNFLPKEIRATQMSDKNRRVNPSHKPKYSHSPQLNRQSELLDLYSNIPSRTQKPLINYTKNKLNNNKSSLKIQRCNRNSITMSSPHKKSTSAPLSLISQLKSHSSNSQSQICPPPLCPPPRNPTPPTCSGRHTCQTPSPGADTSRPSNSPSQVTTPTVCSPPCPSPRPLCPPPWRPPTPEVCPPLLLKRKNPPLPKNVCPPTPKPKPFIPQLNLSPSQTESSHSSSLQICSRPPPCPPPCSPPPCPPTCFRPPPPCPPPRCPPPCSPSPPPCPPTCFQPPPPCPPPRCPSPCSPPPCPPTPPPCPPTCFQPPPPCPPPQCPSPCSPPPCPPPPPPYPPTCFQPPPPCPPRRCPSPCSPCPPKHTPPCPSKDKLNISVNMQPILPPPPPFPQSFSHSDNACPPPGGPEILPPPSMPPCPIIFTKPEPIPPPPCLPPIPEPTIPPCEANLDVPPSNSQIKKHFPHKDLILDPPPPPSLGAPKKQKSGIIGNITKLFTNIFSKSKQNLSEEQTFEANLSQSEVSLHKKLEHHHDSKDSIGQERMGSTPIVPPPPPILPTTPTQAVRQEYKSAIHSSSETAQFESAVSRNSPPLPQKLPHQSPSISQAYQPTAQQQSTSHAIANLVPPYPPPPLSSSMSPLISVAYPPPPQLSHQPQTSTPKFQSQSPFPSKSVPALPPVSSSPSSISHTSHPVLSSVNSLKTPQPYPTSPSFTPSKHLKKSTSFTRQPQSPGPSTSSSSVTLNDVMREAKWQPQSAKPAPTFSMPVYPPPTVAPVSKNLLKSKVHPSISYDSVVDFGSDWGTSSPGLIEDSIKLKTSEPLIESPKRRGLLSSEDPREKRSHLRLPALDLACERTWFTEKTMHNLSGVTIRSKELMKDKKINYLAKKHEGLLKKDSVTKLTLNYLPIVKKETSRKRMNNPQGSFSETLKELP